MTFFKEFFFLTNDSCKQNKTKSQRKCQTLQNRSREGKKSQPSNATYYTNVQHFSHSRKKNFCCLQIPITFIVTQCLIFLFLSFHSFRQSLVTIKIKKINIFEKVKKKKKSDNGKETFVQPLRFVSIHCIYLQICVCGCQLYIRILRNTSKRYTQHFHPTKNFAQLDAKRLKD